MLTPEDLRHIKELSEIAAGKKVALGNDHISSAELVARAKGKLGVYAVGLLAEVERLSAILGGEDQEEAQVTAASTPEPGIVVGVEVEIRIRNLEEFVARFKAFHKDDIMFRS